MVSHGKRLGVGKVLGPHGIRGLLRIHPYAMTASTIPDVRQVFLKTGPEEERAYRVLSVRPHKQGYLLKLEGLDTRDAAETLRNAELCVERDTLARSSEEYFWDELIGLEVYLDTGVHLGRLSQIIPTGGHDIYMVSDRARQIPVPAITEVVREIDLEKGTMMISPTEGLLDLYAV